jgi:hypothetical protein
MTDENIRDRIKPGDRVRLRSGVVLNVTGDRDILIGGSNIQCWFKNGVLGTATAPALDIVEILPRPMTDAERLAKIAEIAAKPHNAPLACLGEIHALAAPPAPLDPGRDVTQEEWDDARQYGQNNAAEAATCIVRARLAEAEAARHE